MVIKSLPYLYYYKVDSVFYRRLHTKVSWSCTNAWPVLSVTWYCSLFFLSGSQGSHCGVTGNLTSLINQHSWLHVLAWLCSFSHILQSVPTVEFYSPCPLSWDFALLPSKASRYITTSYWYWVWPCDLLKTIECGQMW